MKETDTKTYPAAGNRVNPKQCQTPNPLAPVVSKASPFCPLVGLVTEGLLLKNSVNLDSSCPVSRWRTSGDFRHGVAHSKSKSTLKKTVTHSGGRTLHICPQFYRRRQEERDNEQFVNILPASSGSSTDSVIVCRLHFPVCHLSVCAQEAIRVTSRFTFSGGRGYAGLVCC